MLALLLAATLGAPEKPTLLVLDLVPRVGVSPDLAKALTDVAVAQTRKRAVDNRVIGTEEVRSLLDVQAQKSKLGCSDTGCLAELGGALGARQVLWGSLAKVGEEFVIDLRLVDTAKATVLKEATRTLGGRDEQLLNALPGCVDEIFGIAAAPLPPAPQPIPQPPYVQPPPTAPPYVATAAERPSSALVTWGEVLTGVGVLCGAAAGGAMGFGAYTNGSIQGGGFATSADIQGQANTGQIANSVAWGAGIPAIALVVAGATLWIVGAATR